MTTDPDTRPAEPVCCGLVPGAWLPGAGKPQAHACQLCKDSGRYWAESAGVRERRAAAGQG